VQKKLWAGAVIVLGASAIGLTFRTRAESPPVIGPGERPTPPPIHAVPLPSGDDPFPFDRYRHIFDTRRNGAGEGMIVFERSVTGRDRLRDGLDYWVVATRVKSQGRGDGRIVSREWLRSTGDAIVCGRRQEGPLVSDLEPVQTLLVLPLAAGTTWRWSGLSGGRPCSMESRVEGRVRTVVGAGTFEDAWRVHQETRSEDGVDRVTRDLLLQPGVGLVEEKATIVTDRRTLELDAALLRLEDSDMSARDTRIHINTFSGSARGTR
jgi:hypothetical protein